MSNNFFKKNRLDLVEYSLTRVPVILERGQWEQVWLDFAGPTQL
jgi:hypothetical protein